MTDLRVLPRHHHIAAPSTRPLHGTTMIDVFYAAADERPGAPALRTSDGTAWHAMTWRAYHDRVEEIAVGLRAMGLAAGDRVGILSANRAEWHIADLGTLAAGLITTPVYATSSSSQVAYILRDACCRVCFVEDGQQLSKVLLRRSELPDLERVVVFDPVDGADDGFVLPFVDLGASGAEALAGGAPGLRELAGELHADAIATLVYTSGTTGPPKGAVLTHGNIMATTRSLMSLVTLSSADRYLSFLPLSHITERCISHFGQIASGGETWFARGLATVADDLTACRPTIFFAVPRLWEKFRAGVVHSFETAPPGVRELGRRYLTLAEQRGDRRSGWGSTRDELEYRVLDASIGRLVRHRLGLDHARLLTCGAAPVHPDLLRWFHGIGLPIAEGYGQTEVSMTTTLNPPDAIRIGTVGRSIPGVEVRIAEDDEILVRGGGNCSGYWNKPDATAELIDADGWMHSGDLGSLDDDGYLRVLGRKKDLIITSYGKNICPSEIETALRYEPLISQAVVVGDNRPFLTALLTVDPRVAHELGSEADVAKAIDDAVAAVNASHSHAEGIRRWRLLPRELTAAAGELTPTLKVRRELVTREFADLVEEMYAEPAERT